MIPREDLTAMVGPQAIEWAATRNQTGFISSFIDPCTEQFIQESLATGGPALEVGAGWGFPSLRLLAKGFPNLSVNDACGEHLDAFMARTPSGSRVSTIVGDLTGDLQLPNGHYQSILVSRVIHFFDGERLELAAERLSSWLAPGGRLFVVGDSIYAKIFEPCRPVYERRRRQGDRWPGWFSGLTRDYKSLAQHLPDDFHFFDETTIATAFVQSGLSLESVTPHARPDYPDFKLLDGRECLGAVFRKRAV